MSDSEDAIKGIGALFVGGIIFLLFGSAVDSNMGLSFELWGALYIIGAVVLAATVVAAGIGALVSR